MTASGKKARGRRAVAGQGVAVGREARLAAALRANLSRRKAQVRLRASIASRPKPKAG